MKHGVMIDADLPAELNGRGAHSRIRGVDGGGLFEEHVDAGLRHCRAAAL